MEDEDPDVRLRASGGVSDRLFFAILTVVAIYLVLLLSACGYIYRVTTSSDGNHITGDFMIGEPHENTTNPELGNQVRGAERFDVPPRTDDKFSNEFSEN